MKNCPCCAPDQPPLPGLDLDCEQGECCRGAERYGVLPEQAPADADLHRNSPCGDALTWAERHSSALLAQYAGLYVACSPSRLLAADADLTAVMSAVEGVPYYAILRLPPSPRTAPTCLLTCTTAVGASLHATPCGRPATRRSVLEPAVPFCAECAAWVEAHGVETEPLP